MNRIKQCCQFGKFSPKNAVFFYFKIDNEKFLSKFTNISWRPLHKSLSDSSTSWVIIAVIVKLYIHDVFKPLQSEPHWIAYKETFSKDYLK